MELHAPLKFRKGYPVGITQKFGANPQNYKPLDGHNGIDFISGLDMDAYGMSIVASHDGTVIRTVADEPMSTKGNGVYTQWEEDGKLWMAVYWHLSEVLVKVGDNVRFGQLLGRMGNSGIVRPAPTPQRPFAGTHLHYGLYVHEKINGQWKRLVNNFDGAVDPMPYFSTKTHALHFNEYQEWNTLERMKVVLYPILWAMRKIKEGLSKL